MAAPKADKKTLALIDEVRRRKAEIAAVEKPVWKTNHMFPVGLPTLHVTPVNLRTQRDVGVLLSLFATLVAQRATFSEALTYLELPPPAAEFRLGGFTFEEWGPDFRLHVKRLQLEQMRESLVKLEERLNAIISPELRRELELAAVESELKQL